MTVISDVHVKGYLNSYALHKMYPSPAEEPERRFGIAASDSDARRHLRSGFLIIEPNPEPDQIQPASIELRTSHRIWESDRVFDSSDDSSLTKYARELPESSEYVLEKGKNYILESREKIRLPWFIYGVTESKSTVGRVGTLCAALGESYAQITETAYPQKVRMVIEPYAFPLIVRPEKTRLFQIRLREKDTGPMSRDELKQKYSDKEKEDNDLKVLLDGRPLPFSSVFKEDGIKLTLDTSFAFKQLENDEPLDLTRTDFYDPKDFWEVVYPVDGDLEMEPNTLYLLGSRETIVMGNIAGRLIREDPFSGTGLWTHFAGLIDPGYNGQLTLEMWSFKKRVVRASRHAGRIIFESLSSTVDKKYGDSSLGSSYQLQRAPRLPKIFKQR